MQHQFLYSILFSFSFVCLFSGCQLLSPYKGPIAPTPDHWKTTYDAPDAGKPTIPEEWKQPSLDVHSIPSLLPEESSKELPVESSKDFPYKKDLLAEAEPVASAQEPQLPSLEDVRVDLWNWWEIFQDPVLNQLEEQALNSSYTLWVALEKVIQARAQARVNFAPLLPGLNFAPSFTRTGSLFQNPLAGIGTGGGNAIGQGSSSCQANTGNASSMTNVREFRFIQSQYLVPLNLTYEVDLWSQLKNNYYSYLIKSQAVSQAYLSVLLSLTADVASTYFMVRGLDAQQEVVERNIRVRKHAVDLNRARYQSGLIVFLDVSRAEVELARARSDSDDVRRLRGLQENILATLVGTPASVFSIAYDPVRIPPPVIPRGLPSELLCRRPDIAEAERNLASSYRQIGVAYANFFPSLSINATLGFESPFAPSLFSWQSRLWQVGYSVFQTVFDGGRNAANLEFTQSQFRELLANYEQTVLRAFQDVEDALVNLRGYAAQAQDLSRAVQAARVTLDLAQMRYNIGLTNYLDVVDAERQLLETEQNSVIVLGNRYVSTVMLIRALGGGWGPCEGCNGCEWCEGCEGCESCGVCESCEVCERCEGCEGCENCLE